MGARAALIFYDERILQNSSFYRQIENKACNGRLVKIYSISFGPNHRNLGSATMLLMEFLNQNRHLIPTFPIISVEDLGDKISREPFLEINGSDVSLFPKIDEIVTENVQGIKAAMQRARFQEE
jgi:hypothetical protein